MDLEDIMHDEGNHTAKIWLGVAIGAAIGIGIAVSRNRKKDRWSTARELTARVADQSGELAEVGRNMLDRIRTIYDESMKVCEEATELWSHGRKLVHR
jgi:hypothetical protein